MTEKCQALFRHPRRRPARDLRCDGGATSVTSSKEIKARHDKVMFPSTANYYAEAIALKEGKGTEFKMTSIKFDQKIPDYMFTKAALKQ